MISRRAVLALLAALWILPYTAWAVPRDPARIPVDTSSVATWEELVSRSDLVVHGRLGEREQAYPTGKREGRFRVFHYVQHIAVTEVWKGAGGTGREGINLLTSGCEPLPEPSNPLNKRYTGPLEGGEYVFFLKKTAEDGYYTLTGIWQGLYPVQEGKAVALLHNGGFDAFDGMPLRAFKSKVVHVP